MACVCMAWADAVDVLSVRRLELDDACAADPLPPAEAEATLVLAQTMTISLTRCPTPPGQSGPQSPCDDL